MNCLCNIFREVDEEEIENGKKNNDENNDKTNNDKMITSIVSEFTMDKQSELSEFEKDMVMIETNAQVLLSPIEYNETYIKKL